MQSISRLGGILTTDRRNKLVYGRGRVDGECHALPHMPVSGSAAAFCSAKNADLDAAVLGLAHAVRGLFTRVGLALGDNADRGR